MKRLPLRCPAGRTARSDPRDAFKARLTQQRESGTLMQQRGSGRLSRGGVA